MKPSRSICVVRDMASHDTRRRAELGIAAGLGIALGLGVA
jgi:hypothetical protein